VDTAAADALERGRQLAASALDLAPHLAEAHKEVGACYAQLRDGENAALHYRRLLELAPDHPAAPQIRRYLETYRRNVTGGP
jgi:Flp pilus assembly protein TadD